MKGVEWLIHLKGDSIISSLILHPFVPVFGKRLLFRAFMYVKRARRVRLLRGARAVHTLRLPLFS
jgi:hypothetical protein